MPDIGEQGLPAPVQAALAHMRQRIEQQAREIEHKGREIAWRDARLEKLQIELARLNRWKFGVKTEAMTAQQRALFAETLVEDEADLQAQLAALQAGLPESPKAPKDAPRRPRRQALPEHLRVWAYARSVLDGPPGVIYEFCAGRGAQYPLAFLGGRPPPYAERTWSGTLVCDQYAGYGPVLAPLVHPGRQAAGCAVHARRKFEELTPRNAGASPVAVQALQRWARIYHVEAQFAGMTPEDRRDARQRLSKPLWEELTPGCSSNVRGSLAAPSGRPSTTA